MRVIRSFVVGFSPGNNSRSDFVMLGLRLRGARPRLMARLGWFAHMPCKNALPMTFALKHIKTGLTAHSAGRAVRNHLLFRGSIWLNMDGFDWFGTHVCFIHLTENEINHI